jgi:hypothetical protein
MIKTEEQIVYQILNTVRGAQINNDEPVSERLIRSYIQEQRAAILYNKFFYGMTITDEVFQFITLNSFEIVSPTELKHALPHFISFEENFGLKMSKYGEYIPIIGSEEFRSTIKTNYGKAQVKATVENNYLKLYKGNKNCCINDTSIQVTLINHFQSNKPSAELQIVLVNPSDDINYDWTKTPFPFPPEYIESLIRNILSVKFNIIISTGSDKIGDNNAENFKE